MPKSCRRLVGFLLLISVLITVGISTVIAGAVAQKESEEIVLNTISAVSDKNGTISKIINNSRTVIGFDKLKQALDNETKGQIENATGIVINNIPPSIRIEKSLNATNTAVVEEARKHVRGEPISKTVVYCFWMYFPGGGPWFPPFHFCTIVGPLSS